MIDLFSGTSNYHVMSTDYDSYTVGNKIIYFPLIKKNIFFLVMGCDKYWFIRVEYFWILSREAEFRSTDEFSKILNYAVEDLGIDEDNLISQETTNCGFDYKELYESF